MLFICWTYSKNGCGWQIRTADAPGLWDRCGDHPTRYKWSPMQESNLRFMVPNHGWCHFTNRRKTIGAPWQNRTAVTWLQNRCNTIILIGRIWLTGYLSHCTPPVKAIILAPQEGIEPPTNWLTVNCTTAVLLWNKNNRMIFVARQP